MNKLSEFLGEILKDISSARTYADYSTAAISEEYFADPFIKSLPVPHYIIDEAEVDVPIAVVGINTQSDEFEKTKKKLERVLTVNLNKVLSETFKWNYINQRIKRQKSGDMQVKDTTDYTTFIFDDDIKKVFDDCIGEICKVVISKFKQNIGLYNYKVLKLLEITETFKKELGYALKDKIKIYFANNNKNENNDYNPFLTDDSIVNAINYTSSIIFFNFKKVMLSNTGVLVEVNTSKMNEYAHNDCLMHIKLKIKEQDLALMVEEEGGKEKRYLSLV